MLLQIWLHCSKVAQDVNVAFKSIHTVLKLPKFFILLSHLFTLFKVVQESNIAFESFRTGSQKNRISAGLLIKESY